VKIKTKLAVGAAAVAVIAAGTAGVAQAAGTNLKCFGTSSGSTCTQNKDGSIILTNDAAGEYAGVYVPGQGLVGKPLSSVTALQFGYKATMTPNGGNPRLNLYITNAAGQVGTVFIDTRTCNTSFPDDADLKVGFVNPLSDPSCAVSGYYDGGSSFSYPSWKAFLVGEANAKFAAETPEIMIDSAYQGSVALSDVKLSLSGRK
jgi:hypothetical protein